MIGKLSGILEEKQSPWLLIDVGGVGYEVEVSMTTYCKLPEIGAAVALRTHLQVREDAQSLFGFYDLQERELFRNLIKVNGVGPRLALAILSGMNVEQFTAAVMNDDTSMLVKLPGVGKKTAQRLVLDLRDRLPEFAIPAAAGAAAESIPIPLPASGEPHLEDALSALVALGFKPQDASRAIERVKDESGETSEEVIRAALQLGVKQGA